MWVFSPSRADGYVRTKTERYGIVAAMRSKTVVFLAVWFGLLTGLAEVSILGAKKFFLQRMLFLGPNFVWMTPLADILVLICFGLGLWLIALRWPRVVSLRSAVFVFAFIGMLSLLLMYPRLYRSAQFLLATGVATQIAQLASSYSQDFHILVRRTIGPMVVWWLDWPLA